MNHKFRVWDKVDRQHKDKQYLLSSQGYVVDAAGNVCGPEYVLEFFTGYQDQNGVDIYDGDIVQRNSEPARRIIWLTNQWCLSDMDANPDSAVLLVYLSDYQKIGYIHETSAV